MFNPFSEQIDESDDLQLVELAKGGSRDALERLVLRHQAWIYNISVRMVFHPQDAEEVTQEVLIKAITHLGTFQGGGQFRTWLYRIAVNHVLNMKRRGGETVPQTFSSYANAINETPDLDLPDPKLFPVDSELLVEETKISCTTGMLLCLDRKQRLIFTLGAIFGVSDTLGSDLMEMTPDSFRQNLARARRDLFQFMNGQCGLVNSQNPCRCPKKTRGFIEAGHVDPNQLQFAGPHVLRIRDAAVESVHQIDDVVGRAYVALFRDHPFLEPQKQLEWIRQTLDEDTFRNALRFN